MNFKRKYEGGLDLIWDLDNIVGDGIGVEVGVFRGELTKQILRLWKGGTIYMIDVWRELGNEYSDICNNDEHMSYLVDACNNIKGHEDRAIILRATSEIASKVFSDNSVDFIYIDGNHSYEFVKKDLEIWYPKLKKGGVFSGHDYINIDWYDDTIKSKTQMTSDGEVTIDWKNLPDQKNKELYKIQNGQRYCNGIFGVNPAVDEFCSKYGHVLDVTTEIWGSWWFIK